MCSPSSKTEEMAGEIDGGADRRRGVDRCSRERPLQRGSGILGSTDRRVKLLCRKVGGQRVTEVSGDVKTRRRNHLPAAACAARRVGCGC